VTLSLGLFTRASAIYTVAFVGYNLFLSETHFRHNRAYLFINLAFLALIPCGRLLSLDALRARRRGQPRDELASLWPMYLLRFEAVSIYMASGSSKLINPDWWSGLVTYSRVHRFRGMLEASIAPDWLVALVTDRGFHHGFGKVAILTELLIAATLVFPATRRAGIWVAIVFHLGIGIGLQVEVFSYLAVAATLIWATPRTRDRVLIFDERRPGGRLLAFCARRLDWLARLQLRPHRGTGEPAGASGRASDSAPIVTLIDRDGRTLTGAPAARLALSRCPLLFVAIAPFNLPGARVLWDRALRSAFGA
jgi:hypothetical protein